MCAEWDVGTVVDEEDVLAFERSRIVVRRPILKGLV